MAEQPPTRAFYTVAQLATRWQVSERTIRRMIEHAELRALRIGPQLRVPVEEVEQFEARQAMGSGP